MTGQVELSEETAEQLIIDAFAYMADHEFRLMCSEIRHQLSFDTNIGFAFDSPEEGDRGVVLNLVLPPDTAKFSLTSGTWCEFAEAGETDFPYEVVLTPSTCLSAALWRSEQPAVFDRICQAIEYINKLRSL